MNGRGGSGGEQDNSAEGAFWIEEKAALTGQRQGEKWTWNIGGQDRTEASDWERWEDIKRCEEDHSRNQLMCSKGLASSPTGTVEAERPKRMLLDSSRQEMMADWTREAVRWEEENLFWRILKVIGFANFTKTN